MDRRQAVWAGWVAAVVLGAGTTVAGQESLLLEEEPAVQAAPLAQAHLERSRELEAQGNVDAAVEELDKALRLSSRLPSAYFAQAELLRRKGDVEAAVQAYTHAIEALALAQYLR